MSSRSIYIEKSSRSEASAAKARCPACGRGHVERVLASRTYNVDGNRFRVDGLMPEQCDACGELTWPEAELKRADEVLAIKLRNVRA